MLRYANCTWDGRVTFDFEAGTGNDGIGGERTACPLFNVSFCFT